MLLRFKISKTKQNKAKEYHTYIHHGTAVPKTRNNLVREKRQSTYKGQVRRLTCDFWTEAIKAKI